MKSKFIGFLYKEEKLVLLGYVMFIVCIVLMAICYASTPEHAVIGIIAGVFMIAGFALLIPHDFGVHACRAFEASLKEKTADPNAKIYYVLENVSTDAWTFVIAPSIRLN